MIIAALLVNFALFITFLIAYISSARFKGLEDFIPILIYTGFFVLNVAALSVKVEADSWIRLFFQRKRLEEQRKIDFLTEDDHE